MRLGRRWAVLGVLLASVLAADVAAQSAAPPTPPASAPPAAPTPAPPAPAPPAPAPPAPAPTAPATPAAPALDPPPLGAFTDFSLESTRGTRRTLAEARGRVVIVFYEDREHTSDNHELKLLLHRYIEDNQLRASTTTYGIANVSGVPSVMHGMARSAIRSLAEGWGIELLFDWTGVLGAAPLSFPRDRATVALFDREGRLRFRRSGALDEAGRSELFRVLRRLLREPVP